MGGSVANYIDHRAFCMNTVRGQVSVMRQTTALLIWIDVNCSAVRRISPSYRYGIFLGIKAANLDRAESP
jgi:hypothetical protein